MSCWYKESKETLGPVDILVDNSGITSDSMFHKMSKEQWGNLIDTNLNGLFNMSHPACNGMRIREFGRIVNFSSIYGQKGKLGQANYSCCKRWRAWFHKVFGSLGGKKRNNCKFDIHRIYQ